MLIPNHPDDERLSALASGDADATADASLTEHVASCTRCTDLVDELGALRASLAELPDLAPSRPLRLLPPVEADASRVDRVGGWARRFFAPVLSAGAALALVGLIGTTSAFQTQEIFQNVGSALQEEVSATAAEAPAAGGEGGVQPPATDEATNGEALSGADTSSPAESNEERAFAASSDEAREDGDDASTRLTAVPAERSPWPMVLFTGVALMVAAALLRWILVPRAG